MYMHNVGLLPFRLDNGAESVDYRLKRLAARSGQIYQSYPLESPHIVGRIFLDIRSPAQQDNIAAH